MNNFRKLILCNLSPDTTILEILRKSEFDLDESDFLIGEFEKVFCRTDSPTSFLKPFFLTLFHGLSHFVIGSESFLTSIDHTIRCFLRFLAKYSYNYNCILVDSVYDSPSCIGIIDSQFMAPSTDGRQRSRVRKAKLLTKLKLAQQEACLDAGFLGKWWSSNFAFKPDEGLVSVSHQLYDMSNMTYCQVQ